MTQGGLLQVCRNLAAAPPFSFTIRWLADHDRFPPIAEFCTGTERPFDPKGIVLARNAGY
jgi:hypothetical protein